MLKERRQQDWLLNQSLVMHAYSTVKLLRKTVFVGDFCTMHLTRDVDLMMYTMIHTTMIYI